MAARAELRHSARELQAIRDRLARLVLSLPAATADDDDASADAATEMRSAIECVLADDIGPAIDDLLAAARYEPGEAGGH